MRALALLLLTVAGCDLVFGVDPGQGDGPDADLDATPSSELVRVRIDVDVVTTVVTREPGALDLGRSYVLVDDQVPARRVELTEVVVGEYTAPVPVGAGFRLVRPDPVSGVLHVSELPARDQRWASTFVGHRDEVPASKSDAFELDILRDGAGVSSCVLLVTGAWLSGLVPGCEDSGSLSLVTGPIRWSTLTSISGRPAARPQAGDLVYLLRYLGGSTAGALVDVGPVFVPGTTLISGSMAATTINQRAELTVIDHGLEARLRAADPTPSAAAGVQRWDFYAMWSVPALFAGLGLVGSADGFTAGAISTSFANPFAWPAYVVVQQTFERDTTVGGPGQRGRAGLAPRRRRGADPGGDGRDRAVDRRGDGGPARRSHRGERGRRWDGGQLHDHHQPRPRRRRAAALRACVRGVQRGRTELLDPRGCPRRRAALPDPRVHHPGPAGPERWRHHTGAAAGDRLP